MAHTAVLFPENGVNIDNHCFSLHSLAHTIETWFKTSRIRFIWGALNRNSRRSLPKGSPLNGCQSVGPPVRLQFGGCCFVLVPAEPMNCLILVARPVGCYNSLSYRTSCKRIVFALSNGFKRCTIHTQFALGSGEVALECTIIGTRSVKRGRASDGKCMSMYSMLCKNTYVCYCMPQWLHLPTCLLESNNCMTAYGTWFFPIDPA